MATKKASLKKKTVAKRTTGNAKKASKKVTKTGKSLAKRATSTASKLAKRTKRVAEGAQKVGRAMKVIGKVVEAGGIAAENLTEQVESSGRKTSIRSRKKTSR